MHLGFSGQPVEAEMHSHLRSSPGRASLLTLLPAQVGAMTLTSAGTHGTSAGAKAVSHLPAMERKDSVSTSKHAGQVQSHSQSIKCHTETAESLGFLRAAVKVRNGINPDQKLEQSLEHSKSSKFNSLVHISMV